MRLVYILVNSLLILDLIVRRHSSTKNEAIVDLDLRPDCFENREVHFAFKRLVYFLHVTGLSVRRFHYISDFRCTVERNVLHHFLFLRVHETADVICHCH